MEEKFIIEFEVRTYNEILNKAYEIYEENIKLKKRIKNIKKERKLLIQENIQLKDNWKKLKKYVENKIDEYDKNLEFISSERMCYIHNKMQDLEKGE